MKRIIFFSLFFVGCAKQPVHRSVGDVIQAEEAFAQLSVSKNLQDAFLANMNDQSLIDVKGKFVKGLPIYQQQAKDTSGKLKWYPTFASVAASGEFGYTTGPWSYRQDGKLLANGYYATVWKKQPDGQWKFIVDLGNSFDTLNKISIKQELRVVLPDKIKSQSESEMDLLAIDSSFASEIAKSPAVVNERFFHPDMHILWPNRLPFNSTVYQRNLRKKEETYIVFHPEQCFVATSNDLGVVLGSCKPIFSDFGKTRHQFVYMHVWRKDARKGWQLLHETIK